MVVAAVIAATFGTAAAAQADGLGGETYTPYISSPFVKLYEPTDPAPGHYMNDHTFTQAPDGSWQVIGISGGGNGAETSFASASGASLDRGPWTAGPVVAQYQNASGQAMEAWAPSAVRVGAKTYLFYRTSEYPGQHNSGAPGVDQLGLLTRTDSSLSGWTRESGVTARGMTPHFRDPMIMADGSGYLMYATGTEPVTGRNIVAQYSSTDLKNWVYEGVAFSLSGSAPQTSWSAAESPFVFKYGNYYYLSVTDTTSSPDTYHNTIIVRSSDPKHFGDYDGSSITGAGTLVTKLPVHAPEYMRDASGQWYVSTAGWRDMSIYPEAKRGVAVARLDFRNDHHAVPKDGQELSYSFDDAFVAKDSSGNGRDTSLSGSATKATNGEHGGSLALDATPGRLNANGVSYSGDFTIGGWIKTAAAPTNANGLFTGPGIDFNLFQGKPRLYVGRDIVVSSATVPAGEWTHIALTRSGTTVTVWVNGVATGTGTWAGTLTPTAFATALAAPAQQSVDDLVMYSRAVGTAGMATLAGTTGTVPPAGLDARYTFDDAAAPGVVIDGSGHGRDSVAVGATGHADGRYGASLIMNANAPGSLPVTGVTLAGDFTIASWVRASGTVTNTTGIFKGAGVDLNLYQGKPRLYVGSDVVVGSSTVVRDQWTHIALTRQGSTLRLYVNGVLDATGTWSGTLVPSQLGAALAGSQKVELDDVLMYSRALSGSEIAGLT